MKNDRRSRGIVVPPVIWILGVLIVAEVASALEMEKLKVQRKEVFEFTEKPKVTREVDTVTIAFASKDYCDATVAIENEEGKIVRHLASGVLGKNAPLPFQKDSLKQTVIWDGKDEIGRYVDDKDSHTVRVSLGLRPRMERTLFWSPARRVEAGAAKFRAAPEGVYVLDVGHGTQVRLFDHEGNYVRTVYPFPADKLGQVQGLKWLEFPPGNEKLPSKLAGHDQDTVLQENGFQELLIHGKRIFLLGDRLTRLGTDGTTDGLNLNGPEIGFPVQRPDQGPGTCGPAGAAMSPDGKTLYMAGHVYAWSKDGHAHVSWFHGVKKMDPAADAAAVPFAGEMKRDKEGAGSDDAHFNMPADVACDAKGRVCVADYHNDRIQVFMPDGKLAKTIPTFRPAMVRIDPAKGDLWVFSWPRLEHYYYAMDWNWVEGGERRKPTLTHLGPMEDPKVIVAWELPVQPNFGRGAYGEVDFYAQSPTIWLANDSDTGGDAWKRTNIKLLRPEAGGRKLEVVRDFGAEAQKALARARPIRHGRQRVFVNEATGMVYVGEHTQPTVVACKSFFEVIKIDPSTGKIKLEQLPTDPEDMGFDYEGRMYLRVFNGIARFDPATWREIPYDYGEERMVFHGQGGGGEKPYRAASAITVPSGIGGMFHLSGFGVSPQGNCVVGCINPSSPEEKKRLNEKKVAAVAGGGAYTPPVYPGRNMGWETHIFDIHGKLLKADAVPGIGFSNMLQIDRDGNVYVLASSAPYLDGKPYFNGRGCTLIKLVPGKMKCLTPKGIIPLAEAAQPKRSMDMTRPDMWVEGAEWLFGPVGADGHYGSGGKCSCYVNGRFALDYFARSFAPEVDRFRVAVLDTNGNVITRIGRFGNVDDGTPIVKDGGPPNPRAIGGDETAIMRCMNLGVQTDRRLFLCDIGNQCIRSVKLGYHAEEKVALKDVADVKK